MSCINDNDDDEGDDKYTGRFSNINTYLSINRQMFLKRDNFNISVITSDILTGNQYLMSKQGVEVLIKKKI